MSFREVDNKVDFVALEHEILRFWRESDAFNKLRRLRAGAGRRRGRVVINGGGAIGGGFCCVHGRR